MGQKKFSYTCGNYAEKMSFFVEIVRQNDYN